MGRNKALAVIGSFVLGFTVTGVLVLVLMYGGRTGELIAVSSSFVGKNLQTIIGSSLAISGAISLGKFSVGLLKKLLN